MAVPAASQSTNGASTGQIYQYTMLRESALWSMQSPTCPASCFKLFFCFFARFLANLPGNTMALALKYRLLCGSVVLSSPFLYHEWYYSQLKESADKSFPSSFATQ